MLAILLAIGDDLKRKAVTFLPRIPAEDHPCMVEYIHQHLRETDPRAKSTAKFRLNLLLVGLERMRDAN